MVIYLSSTFVLFALASWIFYHAAKRNMIHQQYMSLQAEAKHLHSVLRQLHQSEAPILYYPKATRTHSAIFDIDRRYIFGNFTTPIGLDAPMHERWMRLVVPLDSYYLGAAYLLLARPIDTEPMAGLLRNIVLFMIGGGVVFAVLGYFLGRLFIAPMRESVEQMNRFIDDTTHELNTPISTILTNIEMIEALDRGHEVREELGRIAIASRTLSRMYDDLTYLRLNHAYHRQVRDLAMATLVQERIDYFRAEAEAKGVEFHAALSPVSLRMDENDAVRLIDNLLSNAVKYNRTDGTVSVTLDAERLIVADTGIGIAPEKIATLHERFRRANTSEGGFGIGLNIVHRIVHHYGYTMQIDSREDHGTEVTILWHA
jgi:two-component system OmpR family sensor kinase